MDKNRCQLDIINTGENFEAAIKESGYRVFRKVV